MEELVINDMAGVPWATLCPLRAAKSLYTHGNRIKRDQGRKIQNCENEKVLKNYDNN